ncbi:MAG: hypothetical protein ACRDXE_10760, partial [Acidimicrobiales bacterium]
EYITSFQAALSSGVVIDQLHGQTGVPKSELTSGLSAKPSGVNSVILQVTYQGKRPNTVRQVPVLASRDTLVALARPQLDVAQRTLASVQSTYSAAKAAADHFAASSGVQVPLEAYRAQAGQVNLLQVAYLQATALNAPSAAALHTDLANAQQVLTSLAAVAAQDQNLAGAESAAATNLSNAQSQLSGIQAQLAGVNAPSAVAAGEVTKVKLTSTLIKLVAPAVVVALILAIGLVVLLESLRARRGRGAHTAEADRIDLATADSPGTHRLVNGPDDAHVDIRPLTHAMDNGRPPVSGPPSSAQQT